MTSLLIILQEIASDTVKALKDPEIIGWSGILGIAMPILKTYFFADFQFLIFLGVVIMLNTISKVYVIFRDTPNEFSIKTLVNKFSDKIIKYTIALICIHVLTHFTINGEQNQFFTFVTHFFYGVFIVSETRPTLERLGIHLPEAVTEAMHKFLKKKTE